jgi:hypothetical protein
LRELRCNQAVGATHSRTQNDVVALGHLLHTRGWLHASYVSGAAQIIGMTAPALSPKAGAASHSDSRRVQLMADR